MIDATTALTKAPGTGRCTRTGSQWFCQASRYGYEHVTYTSRSRYSYFKSAGQAINGITGIFDQTSGRIATNRTSLGESPNYEASDGWYDQTPTKRTMIDFIDTLKSRNEPLYYFGLVCLICAIICLILTRITEVNILGTNAWFKPFKFFLSTTIFLWSMAWYLGYLPQRNAIIWYTWGMIAIFVFEDGYVALQAARGQLSHFNTSTPSYATLYSLMAAAATAISIWTAYITIPFFTNSFPELPHAYVWGIRSGIVIFVIFSMQGFAMGARLTHTVGGADGSVGIPLTNWSKIYGDLRIAHCLGMHALQVIPILSYYVVQNVKTVVLVAIVYGLMTTAIFVQALQGKPFLR